MQDSVNLLVAFTAGTFSFLSPCVLPLFPSYLSFITGMSVDELSAAKSRSLKPVITNSLMFISGFSIVFIATGASLGSLGGLLLDYRNIVQVLGGLLIIFFGLYITGVLKLTFLGRYIQRERITESKDHICCHQWRLYTLLDCSGRKVRQEIQLRA